MKKMDWLLSQMDEVSVAEYMPPEIAIGTSDMALRTGGAVKRLTLNCLQNMSMLLPSYVLARVYVKQAE
ncbi:MAG: hypothetical protein RBR82_11395 [Pseudomonas sp.]|nr:hypothetical protein [Pseudomonas sp.]